MRRHSRRRFGFTLAEVMIVVVLLGILTAIALPVWSSSTVPAGRSSAQADLIQLQSYMTDAYQQTGQYPASTAGYVSSAIGSFHPSSTNTYQITTAGGGQSSVIAVWNANLGVTCTMTIGTGANPGQPSC